MSNVSEQVHNFLDLLTVVGNEIPADALSKLKVLLRGHVDKDALNYVETGSQLLLILHRRGLVTNKRVSFLRKFLKDAKCEASLSYLNSYEEKNKTPTNESYLRRVAIVQDDRKKRLHNLVKQVESEIHVSEDKQENIKHNIESLQNEIQREKEIIIEHEDSIKVMKLSIASEQLLMQSVRRKLEDLKYVIRKLYREEESLTEKQNNNAKPKRAIRDELASKRVEIKGKELLEGELTRKYERIAEQIRLLHADVRHQTNEIIDIETKIQEDMCKMRILKKDISKEIESSEELNETLAEIKQQNSKVSSASISTSLDTGYLVNPPSSFSVMNSKVIDCSSLVQHEQPLIIGRHGTNENPPQFIHPCSAAIDISDKIYVADSMNARIQILSLNGNPVRKPIHLGTNFQPTSIAVNLLQNIFVSDSHVIRMYSSNGELLRYILPIYGKNDIRPIITGLGITKDGTILLVDAANKHIQEFREDGTFHRFIGENHEFKSPSGVTVAKNCDIIVTDACQIKIFDKCTESVKNIIGTRGIGKGKFLNLLGLTVDNDNNIIVADCESHQIHVLSYGPSEDMDHRSFGSLGTDAGFFDTPYDVVVSSDGRKIVVVEKRNHRLQVFTRNQPQLNYGRYIAKDDVHNLDEILI